MKMKMKNMKMHVIFKLFLRRAHNTEHPSRGCPHLVLISQLSRLKQCGLKSLAQGENILMLRFEPATFVSKIDILTTTPIVHIGL